MTQHAAPRIKRIASRILGSCSSQGRGEEGVLVFIVADETLDSHGHGLVVDTIDKAVGAINATRPIARTLVL